jgi:hypothetical protein
LKSPTTIESGSSPVLGLLAAGVKLPLPSRSRTVTLFESRLAVARSWWPSRSKSPAATAWVPSPAVSGLVGAALKSPGTACAAGAAISMTANATRTPRRMARHSHKFARRATVLETRHRDTRNDREEAAASPVLFF